MELTQLEFIELMTLIREKRSKLQLYDSTQSLLPEAKALDKLHSKLSIFATAQYITEKKITNYLPKPKKEKKNKKKDIDDSKESV